MAKKTKMVFKIRYTAAHAGAVHENPSSHDFDTGGPKFLEGALRDAVSSGMNQRMAMKAFNLGALM